jgi:hypothetical protein
LAWLPFATTAYRRSPSVLCTQRRQKSRQQLEDRENKMPESKNDFRKALAGVIDARGREATRSVARNREHLLLGALTKRPN